MTTGEAARDKLLQAIGQEAQEVADKQAGNASSALAELARAYALVVSGQVAVPVEQPQVEATNPWTLFYPEMQIQP